MSRGTSNAAAASRQAPLAVGSGSAMQASFLVQHDHPSAEGGVDLRGRRCGRSHPRGDFQGDRGEATVAAEGAGDRVEGLSERDRHRCIDPARPTAVVVWPEDGGRVRLAEFRVAGEAALLDPLQGVR
ncbi:MAG: hypothetical protein ACO3NL_15675, partial [Phycisphaerales bacterium]